MVGETEARTARRIAASALAYLACVAAVLALLFGYVERVAVDSNQFANRATDALRSPAVKSLIAARLTDDVILSSRSDLIAARPLIQSAVSTIVGSSAFTGLFRSAVADVHRAVFNHDEGSFTLTVKDVGAVVAGALQALNPKLAEQINASAPAELLHRDIGGAAELAARVAHAVQVLALILALLAVALALAALAISKARRRTIGSLGLGIAAGGVVVVVGLEILRAAAVHHLQTPAAQSAAGAVWDAFLGDLQTAAWIFAGIGALVAATARSLIAPVDLRAPLRRVSSALLSEPARPVTRLLRGLVLIFVGAVLLVDPEAVLELALAVASLGLLYAGATSLLHLVYQPPAERTKSEPRGRARAAATCALAATVVCGAVAVFLAADDATADNPAPGPCEGYEALCQRPLTDVALAATHNAMSVPLPGWYSAEQEKPIPGQLSDGIRGLLFDTYYADRLPNGRLRTEGGDNSKLRTQAREAGVSEGAIDAALRLRERIGFSGRGVRGLYLCHGFCELGGTSLSTVLEQIRDFLLANPDQILVVVNEDYVKPADFVKAVDAAGLGQLAYRGPTTAGQWPTLQQMIDSDQRVVFLAENHAGGAPWYHLAYQSIVEETPYHFKSVSELTDPAQLAASCQPNRGPVSAPLFLMNGWVSTNPAPLPSNAAKVNAYEPLLARARECNRIRTHIPNLVAVDFYRRGDVFKVVDALNGVGGQ